MRMPEKALQQHFQKATFGSFFLACEIMKIQLTVRLLAGAKGADERSSSTKGKGGRISALAGFELSGGFGQDG